jgi:hypothetical protein
MFALNDSAHAVVEKHQAERRRHAHAAPTLGSRANWWHCQIWQEKTRALLPTRLRLEFYSIHIRRLDK